MAGSSGTKIHSVSGDCERPGLYEYPFGVTIRQVVDGVAHHINPGQTYCFPMRLELGRQIGVQFDTAASDNKIYWVIRSYQIRPTDL